MIFKKATGSPITEEDAKVLGREFLRIATAHKIDDLRALSTEIVLDEIIANRRHPLRRFYNWNVEESARAHWLERTRVLLGSIRIVEANVRPRRARKMFVSVKDLRTNSGTRQETHKGARVVAPDAAHREDIFVQCLDEKIRRIEQALSSAEEWMERGTVPTAHQQLLEALRSAFEERARAAA